MNLAKEYALVLLWYLAQEIVAAKPTKAKSNYICSKKCDRTSISRRFCLSDFGKYLSRLALTMHYIYIQIKILRLSDVFILASSYSLMRVTCLKIYAVKSYLFLQILSPASVGHFWAVFWTFSRLNLMSFRSRAYNYIFANFWGLLQTLAFSVVKFKRLFWSDLLV